MNPCLTERQTGFLHWSRTGYETNKDDIRRAFESHSGPPRGTWEDFERHAEQEFLEREQKINNLIARKEREINQLRQVQI